MRWSAAALILLAAGATGPGLAEETRVLGLARVVDGDTLDLGPLRIRLHGIDAPERDQDCAAADGVAWPCGAEATAYLETLAGGRPVDCVAREMDPYGRLVAACSAGGADLSDAMVRAGLAWAFRRYSADYADAEAAARKIGAGVWQADTAPAWDYRATAWSAASGSAPDPDCPIKGNINRRGERIYHVPWSPSYARTRIDPARGERWFCDEAAAGAAGWRPPRGP